jgi:type IV pilus assembly protein PilY1
VSPGDGNGHLFIVNANTGAKILDIPTYSSGTTAVGSTTTPSGLAKINAFVPTDIDNTPDVIYGGDLLGYVWRFDIQDKIDPKLAAMPLGRLIKDSVPQPITSKPALAEITYKGAKYNVIYVGTGKYLGTSDLSDKSVQTIYAIKDLRTTTGWGDVRLATNTSGTKYFLQQVASNATSTTLGNIVKISAEEVAWNFRGGWYVDFIGSGERVNINPHLVLNTIYIGTNTPKSDVCTVGGTSMLYKLDIGTGGAPTNAVDRAAGGSLGNILVMGMTTVELQGNSGTGNVSTIVTRSDGSLSSVVGSQAAGLNALKRVSWRQLK